MRHLTFTLLLAALMAVAALYLPGCKYEGPKRLVARCADRTEVVEQDGRLWLRGYRSAGVAPIEIAPETPLTDVCRSVRN